jgi:rhamnose utilization protein RhaD (predicted bifunctional aldolase and dehydrogenase)
LAKYGTPGTSELADALEPLVPQYDAILMANHGVVAYGEDLQSAYMKMETVEHFAQVALVAHLLGNEQPLQDHEVAKLMVARSKYAGTRSLAPMPVASLNERKSEVEARPPKFPAAAVHGADKIARRSIEALPFRA